MLYSIQLFDCMKQLLLLLILYNGIYTRTYGYLLLDMLRKAVEMLVISMNTDIRISVMDTATDAENVSPKCRTIFLYVIFKWNLIYL